VNNPILKDKDEKLVIELSSSSSSKEDGKV
jgi:hypothetical protein